jgi:two-component system nitrogen regulation response regulator NtrX
VTVDVRVISATNKPLDQLLENGQFRSDLFYRLNVIPFQVPPLRERKEDIPLLVDHFNRSFSADYGKRPLSFGKDALDRLADHYWPGNVRELRNLVERLVIVLQKNEVNKDDIGVLTAEIELPSGTGKYASFKDATESYQREFIRQKLAEAGGSVAKAAEMMGVDRSHLYRRMRNLGIKDRE